MGMNNNRAALLLVVFFLPASLMHGQGGPFDTAIQLNRVTSYTALPYGIDLRDGEARMQIVALRDDVVRIRVSRSDEFAEDASWAVRSEARQSRTAVKPIDTADAVGFLTQALRVSIKRETLALTIS